MDTFEDQAISNLDLPLNPVQVDNVGIGHEFWPPSDMYSVYSRHDDLKQMLDSNRDNLKLEAMKRIIGVSKVLLKVSVLLLFNMLNFTIYIFEQYRW